MTAQPTTVRTVTAASPDGVAPLPEEQDRRLLLPTFDPVSTERPDGRDLLRVLVEADGDEVHLRASGEVDMLSAPLLREALEEAQHDRCSRVVLDLSDVHFLGSDGLGVVVGAHKRCEAVGTQLTVVVGTEAVRRLLRITRLDAVLHVVDVGGR